MTLWQIVLIVSTLLIETGVIMTYNWTRRNQPEYAIWVVLGAKVLRFVLTAAAIISVVTLTDIPTIPFCIWLVVCYLLSMIVESIYFIKKKQNQYDEQ